ncbi:MAG: SAM-dependent methyltransferase, partial [Betaproteobacteria bacterium HGW-Betaproteobacteria-21]
YAGMLFDAVVVSNYLFRPRFDLLLEAVAPGGVLIYETFMIGNEKFGKPSNPDFLLAPGELLQRTAGWHVVAFEQGVVSVPRNAAIQRICVVNGQSEGIALP